MLLIEGPEEGDTRSTARLQLRNVLVTESCNTWLGLQWFGLYERGLE